MIEVRDLTKVYGALTAVQGLSFSVAAGEILGLVGPNGAGKTTTLRSLAEIIRPTRGAIRIAAHDLAQDPIRAKGALAFIPDEPQLFDYLTVGEHLRFTARLYRQPETVADIPAMLAELELSDKADSLASELSRGMRQKLAIACGLLHRSAVLLLDEHWLVHQTATRKPESQWYVCMEHTGIYGLALAHFLDKRQIKIVMECPLRMARSLGFRRSKTDSADAVAIAHYAFKEHERIKVRPLPSEGLLQIHSLLSLRARLTRYSQD